MTRTPYELIINECKIQSARRTAAKLKPRGKYLWFSDLTSVVEAAEPKEGE